MLGRQAAWRPRGNRGGVVMTVDGTVHTELGRQAAWRPRCNHGGVVKFVDSTVLCCCVVIACYLGSACGVQARLSN